MTLPLTQVLKDTTGPKPKNEEHYQNWAKSCVTHEEKLHNLKKRLERTEMVMERRRLLSTWKTGKSCDQRTSTLPSSRVSTEIMGNLDKLKIFLQIFIDWESHAQTFHFCKLKPFWIGQQRVMDRETCACKIWNQVKKLNQLWVTETSFNDCPAFHTL